MKTLLGYGSGEARRIGTPLEHDELFSLIKGGADSGSRLKIQNQIMNVVSLLVVSHTLF